MILKYEFNEEMLQNLSNIYKLLPYDASQNLSKTQYFSDFNTLLEESETLTQDMKTLLTSIQSQKACNVGRDDIASERHLFRTEFANLNK